MLLHLLGMYQLSAAKITILNYTRYEMMNKALEEFGDLRDDDELGPADWPTVKRYITCLGNLEEERSHPHDVPEGDHNLKNISLWDIRLQLLNGLAVSLLLFCCS